MELTSLDRFLWLAGLVGHVLLLLVLVWKRRLASFPFFSALIVFNILRTVALYFVRSSGDYPYFYAYWGFVLVDEPLQLLVFAEVAGKIFRPSGQFSPDARRPLAMIVGAGLVLALLLVSFSSPPEQNYDQRLVLRLALFCNFVLAELFAGLIVLSVTSGFVWKSQTAIVVRGLGVFSVISLLCDGIQNYFGTWSNILTYTATSHLRAFAYMGCLCYWIAGLARTVPVTRPMTEKMAAQLDAFNRYLKAAIAQLSMGGSTS